jgi:hypothetical protein
VVVTTAVVFDELIAALQAAVEAAYGDRLVSLGVFGSVGRGTARPDSDLDFLLVVRGLPSGRPARMREFEVVEAALKPALARASSAGVATRLSPVLKSPEELARGSPLLLDMTEDARVVLDHEGQLAAALARLRDRMRQLGSRRVWCGARWYWVLKPDFKPGEVIEL